MFVFDEHTHTHTHTVVRVYLIIHAGGSGNGGPKYAVCPTVKVTAVVFSTTHGTMSDTTGQLHSNVFANVKVVHEVEISGDFRAV